MSNNSKLTEAIVAILDEGNSNELPPLKHVAEKACVSLPDALAMFPNSYELFVAVSEMGMLRLIDLSTRAVVKVDARDPVAQMKAIGEAYLDWAIADLPLFRVCSNRNILDVEREPRVARYYDSMRRLITSMLDRAIKVGLLTKDDDPEMLLVASRAYIYGLARMVADDHFREWVPGRDGRKLAKKAFEDYVDRVVGAKSAAAQAQIAAT